MNKRIKDLRKKLGMTQKELGSKLGIGQTAIYKIENNVNNLTEQNIKLICKEFNVNEEWLRTGEGEVFKNYRESELDNLLTKEYTLTAPEKSFIEKYLSLPPETRIAMAKMMI